MTRKLLAVVAVALAAITAAQPALAQRGDRDHRRGDDHRGRDRDHDRGHDRGRDHDRGRRDRHDHGSYYGGSYGGYGYGYGYGYGHRHYYRDSDLWIGLGVGSALLGLLSEPDYGYSDSGYDNYGSSYGYGGYAPDPYASAYGQGGYLAANPWGLAPNQCRWDREFGYWYDRPADIEVQRCADAYGTVTIVPGSHRLSRYR
jgi:Ni/Co efflux regulator RcnB